MTADDPYEFLGALEYKPSLWYPSQLPPDIEDFVTTHGRSQAGRPVPVGWGRRRLRMPHRCYEAAGRNYTDPECVYTEGRGLSGGIWRPHAWLTDSTGEVIDLAWHEPGAEYFGVVLPEEIVERALSKLGAYGPLLPVIVHEVGWVPPVP